MPSPFTLHTSDDVYDEIDVDSEYEPDVSVESGFDDGPEILQGVSVSEVESNGTFEGRAIDGGTLLNVALKLDHFPTMTIDDRVKVVGELIVVDVSHRVNKDGKLTRIVKARQQDAYVEPFEDGKDDGVIRS